MATEVTRQLTQPRPAPTSNFTLNTPSPTQASFTTGDVSRPVELPRSWELPAKPKPGRKPNTDTPVDKKRASNRTAQRKFRAKRRQKLEELQADIDRGREETRRKEIDTARRLQDTERKACEEREQLHREIQAARDSEARARQELQILSEGSPAPIGSRRPQLINPFNGQSRQPRTVQLPAVPALHRGPSIEFNTGLITPMSNRSSASSVLSPGSILPQPRQKSAPQATLRSPPGTSGGEAHLTPEDVEDRVSRLPVPNQRPQDRHRRLTTSSAPTSSDDMEIDFTTKPSVQQAANSDTIGSGTGDPCGFCSADTYCMCRENAVTLPEPLEPPATATGPRPILPGTCDTCMRDPEQRKICQDIARRHPPNMEWYGSGLDANSVAGGIGSTPDRDARMHSVTKADRHVTIANSHQTGETVSCTEGISIARNGDSHFAQRPEYSHFLDSVRTAAPQPDRESSSAQDIETASILQNLRGEDRRFSETEMHEVVRHVPSPD